LCKPAKAQGMGHGIWLQWMSVAGPNQCNEDPECSLACVAWKPVETYRSGLLLYHVFCNHENLPEEQHALAAPVTIAAFVSLLAGCYSGKTLSNYFYRVWAWHNIKFCIQHIVPAFSCSWLWYGICLPMIWPLQWWLQLVRTFHTTAILSNQIQIVQNTDILTCKASVTIVSFSSTPNADFIHKERHSRIEFTAVKGWNISVSHSIEGMANFLVRAKNGYSCTIFTSAGFLAK